MAASLDEPIVRQMRGWRHSGFSVDRSVRLAAGDTKGLERLARYLVRYYGWYSNKSRGLRAKSRKGRGDADAGDVDSEVTVAIDEPPTPGRVAARRRWARLIQRVFEVDPLTCPRCGGRMKIIAFIESCQRDVIDRILQHLGLDPHTPPRPDPRAPPSSRDAGPGPVHERDAAERFRSVPDLDQHCDLAPDEGPQVDLRTEAPDQESRDPAF